MDRFTEQQVLDILHLSASQLRYWRRLKLIDPQTIDGRSIYSLQDLISLRTIVRLVGERVPATRLRDVIRSLSEDEALCTKKPLVEMKLQTLSGHIVHERAGVLFEAGTGQQVFNLDDDSGPGEKVSRLRQPTSDEWLALAVRAETEGHLTEARQAYERVLDMSPDCLVACINLGTLFFKTRHLEAAESLYLRALSIDPSHPVARFNLANVLDEMGRPSEALVHLEAAVSLQPDYLDARFNLALLLDKLKRHDQARSHWTEYVRREPTGAWADLARRHLGDERQPTPPDDGSTRVVPIRRRR